MSRNLRHALRAALFAALSSLLLVGLVGPASAAPPATEERGESSCVGRPVPARLVSVQLWTFAEHIGFGTDAATQARHEEVLRSLSEMGYRNVEPFTLSGMTAERYAELLRKYRLQAPARHVDVGTPEEPADIEQILADNRVLGVTYFGSGGTPQYESEAEWTAYAEYLDTVGEQARKAGQWLMVHNHDWEFETTFGDRTAFDVLMQHTERRHVVSQLDLYWVTYAGTDPIDVIEEYGNRIRLLHVKDLNEDVERRIEIVGRGDIDFAAIFRAAGGSTRSYVVEHDPRFGDVAFDPFEAAEEGFAHLTCSTR
ncbi:sugar phosphate isomerase/epimerase [Blastococcus sp. MG754426]|uniref:sugar phosphate isomerase/epimerase family protein n=1 Tax=unclassified Blastococcus TaxID=2619396 RepID=UPI001EEF8FCC|nr:MULTISPECIES: sugar phosphate isomerase/epimerase [unclassified Blastococcus]MCF6508545.1 sugar phosphate isomerase/epimerase [Blastococcus sp. MG754426]MCF6510736.1 sugar phosphate isomerase/epimerase [Blastococcus sp. MG754427]